MNNQYLPVAAVLLLSACAGSPPALSVPAASADKSEDTSFAPPSRAEPSDCERLVAAVKDAYTPIRHLDVDLSKRPVDDDATAWAKRTSDLGLLRDGFNNMGSVLRGIIPTLEELELRELVESYAEAFLGMAWSMNAMELAARNGDAGLYDARFRAGKPWWTKQGELDRKIGIRCGT